MSRGDETIETGSALPLSRRDALKGAAVMGLGLLGASALSGCAPSAGGGDAAVGSTAAAVQWDKEVQVLVAGSGTAVHAAIACAERGAESVLVVEKDPAMFGGTSATSGGGYALALLDFNADEGIDDSREKVLEYMKQVGDGRMDENVQEAFVDNANEFCEFVLATHGWSKWGHTSKAFGDYYELYAGSLDDAYGRGSWYPFDATGAPLMAPAQWEAYRAYVDAHDNVELAMGTAVESLVTDEAGAVVGAQLSDGTAVKANAVILGTGGFEHNEDMRRFYLPFPYYRSNGSANNTGDSQRMGARIGAQLAYMDTTFGNPYFDTQKEWEPGAFRYDKAGSDAFAPRGFPHSVMVNRKGRRFCDESTMYDTMNRAFGTYDTGTLEYVNIPGYWICDATYTETFLLPGYKTPAELPEFVFKFDTLDELADGMGIDKASLAEELAAFNEHAAQGEDPVWHRGEKAVSANTLAMMAPLMSLPDATPPTSVLGTVDTPPYYCCRYVPGMMGGTRGGLHIDEHAQVLDVDGKAVPGLYATGNCSSGVAGYWAGGATLGQGSVMGYVAAKHIMDAAR